MKNNLLLNEKVVYVVVVVVVVAVVVLHNFSFGTIADKIIKRAYIIMLKKKKRIN